jgi:hypothetical protein
MNNRLDNGPKPQRDVKRSGWSYATVLLNTTKDEANRFTAERTLFERA